MIRVGLLDTTVRGAPGSMARYRDQLVNAIRETCSDEIEISIEYLGCDQESLNRYPNRLRMWVRHAHIWNAARKVDSSKYELVHLLDGSFGYVARVVRSRNVVVTVHDVIPRLQMDGVFDGAPPVGRGARWLIQKSLEGLSRANAICADSQNTAEDLKRYTRLDDTRVDVIPLAIEPNLFISDKPSKLRGRFGGPIALHIGNNGFYKNRAGAVEILKRMDPATNLQLVLGGPPPNEQLRRVMKESGVSDRIHFVVDPNQSQLSELYQSAAVFLFPSRYEGFGWPPLEAMSAGCPVISSDAGSLPEVVGNAGVIAKSGDYDMMARACERLLSDTTYRRQIVASGNERVSQFSPCRLAQNMRRIYLGLTV